MTTPTAATIKKFAFDAPSFDALLAARTGWETESDRRTKYRFDSVYHLGAAMPTEVDYLWREVGTTPSGCPMSYDKARTLARAGGRGHDNAARDTVERMRAELRATIRPTGQRMALTPSIAGGVPCVARALGGSPKAMFKPTKKKAPQPVVRLGFHVGRSSFIKEATVYARAAALLALVEDFEQSGQRVELTAVWRNSNMPHEHTDGLDWDVTIKRPGDYYTMDSVAFALDPAFQRRMAWSFVAIEKVIFDAPYEGLHVNLGMADSKQAHGFDYYAPRIEDAITDPRQWYRKLRTAWGLEA